MLFAVDKAVFLDLMDVLPAFSRNLCVVLAKRLETTTLKVPRASGKQLQGNLRYFDLATVIQTLIGSHQTGALVVSAGQAQAWPRSSSTTATSRGRATASWRATTRSSSCSRARSRATSRSPAARCGRKRCRARSRCPRSRCSWSRCGCRTSCRCSRSACRDAERVFRQKAAQLAWDEPEIDRARRVRLVPAQEGGEPRGPAARRAALDLLDLPDGRDAAGERPDPVTPASFRARFVSLPKRNDAF